MITLKLPNKTVKNLLDYINEYINNTCNQKFMEQAIEDKVRIKKAIGKHEGIPKEYLTEFSLKNIINL